MFDLLDFPGKPTENTQVVGVHVEGVYRMTCKMPLPAPVTQTQHPLWQDADDPIEDLLGKLGTHAPECKNLGPEAVRY